MYYFLLDFPSEAGVCICSRHKCFYAAFGQLLRVGSLIKTRTVAGRGRELADMMERLEWCVFVGE